MPKAKTKPPVRHHLDRRAETIASTGEGADDDLLTTQQMALWFGVSVPWLEIGRSNGYGPPFERLAPGVIRYRRGTVKAWLKKREHASTEEYAKREHASTYVTSQSTPVARRGKK